MAKSVAFLLFPGFEMLDFYGPLSVFGSKKLADAYRILTVSEVAGPVPSSYGVSTITEFDFATCPQPDILLVSGEFLFSLLCACPSRHDRHHLHTGGIGTRGEVHNETLLSFMRRCMDGDRHLLTVCTGAGLAAAAGLLDGRRATTNKGAWAWATGQSRGVAWQKQARWVEDGRVWTSAGVTAGVLFFWHAAASCSLERD
jgi:transcriptional regulator GlxA family with amidase domain